MRLLLVTLVLSSWLIILYPTPPVFSDPGTPTPHAPNANSPMFLPLVKQNTSIAPPSSSTHVTSLSAPASVGRYAKYEIVMSLSRTFASTSLKPYYPYSDDAEGITIDAYFTSPSGKTIVMPAFYYQDYLRSGSTSVTMTPTNNFSWRVRFAPVEVGTYRYHIEIRDKTGTSRYPTSGELTFNATASNSRGFVRVSPRDSRFLEFDNGQSFVPIGSGRQWWKCCGMRTLDYEQAFDAFGANGINFTRVWTQDDGWALTVEGHFDGYTYPDDYNPVDRGVNIDTVPKGTQINQRGARELDYIIEAAERNGVYLQLCSRGDPYWIWEYSTINESWNRGLVNSDDPRYLAAWKRNFRYQVARWGYSTAVLAWEHWNEHGHVTQGSALWNFYVNYINFQRQTDPYKHLITTSQGSQAYSPAMWSQLFDIGNYHDYMMSNRYPADLTNDEANFVYRFAWCVGGNGLCSGLGVGDGSQWSGAKKPFVWGEIDVGTTVWNEVNPQVQNGEARHRLLHNSTWAGLFSPIGTSPLDWYWELENTATTSKRLADRKITAQFFAGLDYAGQNFVYVMTNADQPPNYNGAVVTASDARARVYAMRGNSMVLAWVQNREYTWYNAASTPSTFNVTVTIPGVSGSYQVSLFNPQTGTSTSLGTMTANGNLVVSLSNLQKDWAIKAIKQ